MRQNYVTVSLETHLFFARIMKEHALFLMAGFSGKNATYTKKADWFRRQFEALLREVVILANNRIREDVICSGEVVTQYTSCAENRTQFLTGIEIDSRITEAEKSLRAGCPGQENAAIVKRVRRMNQRALGLVKGLIELKEQVLRDVTSCRLFTFNYPLLVEHILREACMYCSLLTELEECGMLAEQDMLETETFWNQIMMEHALFIRGLLDPSEEALIDTADEFAKEYQELLEEAKRQDCRVTAGLEERTIQETLRYRDFKAAGTEGITQCRIAGLILPLLADHVLREANHYLRLLDNHCDA
ncbi:MAG: DUF2935 domain-containing protein [Eubacteriales bacterium]|nr:DUF2935 domain-containing protein [Eubacteriales bacterium]